MRSARIDDAFKLGRGEEAVIDQVFWKGRAVGWNRRRHGRHGGGLHQRSRMRGGTVNLDRLQFVRLIDSILQRALWIVPGFRQVVE